MAAIEVTDLTKSYGDVEAVRGVSFSVEPGEVFAVLGPNGAGKSSIVEILEGHREKTSGTVSVLGFDPGKVERSFRERIGIVLQDPAIEDQLTVEEVIDVYGSMYPLRRKTGELIELVGLEDKTHARIRSLSGGQKRRLELALGIVGDPELIFLDEPTTGFDPSARRHAWSIISNLTSLGKTVLLTTHYMDEAQHLADRVAVIAEGRIVATGTPQSLGGRETANTSITFTIGDQSLEGFPIEGVSKTDSIGSSGGDVTVKSDSPTRDLHRITGWAMDRNLELSDLRVARPSLEDVYLDLTGGGDKDV